MGKSKAHFPPTVSRLETSYPRLGKEENIKVKQKVKR